jgi:hypothetical protein
LLERPQDLGRILDSQLDHNSKLWHKLGH